MLLSILRSLSKQYMQLQKEEEGQINLSRKKRRELFDSQSLIGSIDSEIPWEEMRDNILKEKHNLE